MSIYLKKNAVYKKTAEQENLWKTPEILLKCKNANWIYSKQRISITKLF